MSDQTPDQNLHLPSLVIKNFRGIDELTIPRLGRVTLLAGKNGVGKTTVLDAVRVWADRGLTGMCDAVLIERGDSLVGNENTEKSMVVDRIALFSDRDHAPESIISIGPVDDPSASIRLWERRADPVGHPLTASFLDGVTGNIGLASQFGNGTSLSAAGYKIEGNPTPISVVCNTVGPDGPDDQMVNTYLNEVALTSFEDKSIEALNLAANDRVERVALIDPDEGVPFTARRRLMAKVKGKEYRVPLRTLGEGAMRSFAVALALAKSSDGFLLIDEAENGIHHSIQAKFWNMVLQTAQRNNVQVIATTHSWDCVVGFAQAANDLEDVEGLLVRIERVPIGLRAITYDETRMKSAAKFGIEVR